MKENKLHGVYQGPYTVELFPDASTEHLPFGATFNNGVVSVDVETIQQVMGGIQFYANHKPFSWGYDFIKRIKDSEGEVLWENWNAKD